MADVGYPTDEFSVLMGARGVIEEFGWHQGDMGDAEVGFCVAGAVRRAGNELFGSGAGEPWQAAFDTLRDLVQGDGFCDVGGWNDHWGRTERDVLRMLARAARLHT